MPLFLLACTESKTGWQERTVGRPLYKDTSWISGALLYKRLNSDFMNSSASKYNHIEIFQISSLLPFFLWHQTELSNSLKKQNYLQHDSQNKKAFVLFSFVLLNSNKQIIQINRLYMLMDGIITWLLTRSLSLQLQCL